MHRSVASAGTPLIFATFLILGLLSTAGCGPPPGRIAQIVEIDPEDEARVSGPEGTRISSRETTSGHGNIILEPPPEPDPMPEPDPPPPVACGYWWQAAFFDLAPNEPFCFGQKLVRFDNQQGLWVGLSLCEGPEPFMRIYMATGRFDEFYPVADWEGNGEDQCELVNADFALVDEWNINSGNCERCALGNVGNAAGQSIFTRGFFGEGFEFLLPNEYDPFQNFSWSQINCGVDPLDCIDDAIDG